MFRPLFFWAFARLFVAPACRQVRRGLTHNHIERAVALIDADLRAIGHLTL